MKLYCLQTKGLGDYYVIAPNAHVADQILTKELSDSGYGFQSDRRVITTRLITEQIGKKPFVFSEKRRLIIPENNTDNVYWAGG